MARRKRIPYRPDAFQSYGRRLTSGILDRGRLLIVGLVLAVVVFVVAAIVTSMHATAEEGAWTALGHSGGDVAKLRAALAEYGSCEARTFMLFAVARAEIEPPEEDGRPRPESDDERAARLSRAEDALGELTDDHPGHFLHFYALCLRGQVIEERGRYRDAAAIFETAVASAPKSMVPKIEYDIGRNYYLAGMPGVARSYLERLAGATRTVQVRIPVPGYGYQTIEQEADWIGNARYLLARIGPGERAIPLEEPAREPDKEPEKSDEEPDETPAAPEATPEKALDETVPPEKNVGEAPVEPDEAGATVVPEGE